MNIFVAVFIFVGIMAVTALVFGTWLIVTILRGFVALLFGPSKPIARPQSRAGFGGGVPPTVWRPGPATFVANGGSSSPVPGSVQCGVPGCRRINPAGARFCRRCGHAFPQKQNVTTTRRAAVI